MWGQIQNVKEFSGTVKAVSLIRYFTGAPLPLINLPLSEKGRERWWWWWGGEVKWGGVGGGGGRMEREWNRDRGVVGTGRCRQEQFELENAGYVSTPLHSTPFPLFILHQVSLGMPEAP